MISIALLFETYIGTMPVHHLKMLGRNCINCNMQDTVLAQLLHHPNTAHTSLFVSHVGMMPSTIYRCWAGLEPLTCAGDNISPIIMRSASDPLPQRSHDRSCLAIGARRWPNTGSMLTNSSFIYLHYNLFLTDSSK